MIIHGRVYDVLKQIALIWLPGIGVLYTAVAAAWHFGYVAEVNSTVLAVDTFLGIILGISTNGYKNSDDRFDGELQVIRSGEGDQNLRLKNVSYEALNTKNELTLRILDPDAPTSINVASSTTPPSIASS
jgi:hypothetical protein